MQNEKAKNESIKNMDNNMEKNNNFNKNNNKKNNNNNKIRRTNKGKTPKFNKTRKLEKLVYNIIYLILIFLLLNNIIYFVNIAFTKNDYLSFNNISFLIVSNDIKVFRGSNNEKYYNNNDIICYKVDENIKISRIINIYNDRQNGKKYYVTKYDNNINPNTEKISNENIIGKKIFTIRFLGKFIKLSHTKFVFILEAIILILIFKINNEREKRYNKILK